MNHRAAKDRLYTQLARLTKALASPVRLEMLDLLAQRERTVESLADELALPPANASKHLMVLREAHLVEARRDARRSCTCPWCRGGQACRWSLLRLPRDRLVLIRLWMTHTSLRTPLQILRTPTRFTRFLRWLVMVLVVVGLTPGAYEAVEVIEHLAHDGHLPHGEEHQQAAVDEGHDVGDEHGCTPTQHHCHCCASMMALAPMWPPAFTVRSFLRGESTRYPIFDDHGPSRATSPPFRPPIG